MTAEKKAGDAGKKEQKKKAATLFRFQVPAELEPGVYRQGVGLFPPGSTLTLPDAASKENDVPSASLIPLDEESREYLIGRHKWLADERQRQSEAKKEREEAQKRGLYVPPDIKPVGADAGLPPDTGPSDDRMTIKQVAGKVV